MAGSSGAIEVLGAADGARIRLRVKPGARRTRIVGPHGGALKLEVAAPPERGRANDAVVELLSESLGAPASCVAIVAGTTSQDKTVLFGGLSVEDLVRRLAALDLAADVARRDGR